MKSISKDAAALARWRVQDLREQHVLAMAERVKLQRQIREVVRHLPNRVKYFAGPVRPWAYAEPEAAIEALHVMLKLTYVIRPGYKNRIKPSILLARYEAAVELEDRLLHEAAELEQELEEAGVKMW